MADAARDKMKEGSRPRYNLDIDDCISNFNLFFSLDKTKNSVVFRKSYAMQLECIQHTSNVISVVVRAFAYNKCLSLITSHYNTAAIRTNYLEVGEKIKLLHKYVSVTVARVNCTMYRVVCMIYKRTIHFI